LQHTPPPQLTTDDQFIIGFAGSFYGTTAWNALMSALDSIDWRIGGREVRVRVLGSRLPSERTFAPKHIEFLGYRPWEDVTRLLSQADILYMPSWFMPGKNAFTRLSFPSRLPSYMAAGRPIFYHGEDFGSVMHFLHKYPCGLACHTLDAADIVRTLTQFAEDTAGYQAMCAAAWQAAHEDFSETVLRTRFAQFLGISPMELLSSAGVSYLQTTNR
jgi:glycosyltransferase involved in cell wall biosynthesis